MGHDNPYAQFRGKTLSLTDYLAADRTVLANERTVLAYGRTALALFVTGLTMVRFFDSGVTSVLGWILMPAGVLTMIVGLRGYLKMRRRMAALEGEAPSPSPPTEEHP